MRFTTKVDNGKLLDNRRTVTADRALNNKSLLKIITLSDKLRFEKILSQMGKLAIK